jgi:superfamily II DNA or RNA helicase
VADSHEAINKLKPGVMVRGPMLPEPVRVLVVTPIGTAVQLIGQGLQTNQVRQVVLPAAQLALLVVTPETEPFDGDAGRFKLGVEAMRLKLAYEYDPYFSLSIARIDPLPHQLEAVYDYFLKSPRIRFLLADDPGAGKTIMAGLLIKELKIRGLAQRILIVAPANLTFQWQREMLDKFREQFEVIRGDVLRANYGSNPWQERNQVITSVSWVSTVDDARDSLLRSEWDLIIVDEAHKMSAYSADKKTLAYQLGAQLSERTDHYLLMTATPHKGDAANFALFLQLLDRDVYGDVKSLEEAMRRQEAPFYLRRVKEAMVSFPDANTGQVKSLFTRRDVRTADFHIDADEWDFYDELTRYVEDQSIAAARDDSARGRAIGFTMAMLQRRFASSVYAARRSLERMKARREKILADPEGYRQEQMLKRVPDDFDDLTEEEQEKIMEALEEVVASVDPAALRQEIFTLGRLIAHALELAQREIESKLIKLRQVLNEQGVFGDPRTKLLIFTEHKDTLDFLVGRLLEWGLTVTQIYGGMKIGDRDAPGTRLYAERAFREECQVMVATEAAGEGINLQFCWLMINYDIPWNPVRLEQRMGRIHRYGQEKDCLIFNFAATNTREGRVLQKLLERIAAIERDLDPKRTGKVFNVLGDIFPSNQLERMLREMYAHNLTEAVILDRIVEEVDSERFRRITHSTLEGLAKRELNLTAILGKTAEARERRLVPEVIEDFFTDAAPLVGLYPKESRSGSHVYRLGRVPRTLWARGDELEPRFGRLGREYKQVVFDKERLTADPTLEWVTPGHPLFEAVREEVWAQAQHDLRQGAVFYDLHRPQLARLDLYSAAVRDGLGIVLHQRLFVVETGMDGAMSLRQPTLFLDIQAAPAGTPPPEYSLSVGRSQVEQHLLEQALQPWLDEVSGERLAEVDRTERHVLISLNTLIDRQNNRLADLVTTAADDPNMPGVAGHITQAETRLDDLNNRLERRTAELAQQRHCSLADIQLLGRAWVLPHPERNRPEIAPMVRDEEIERIAVQAAIAYEEARGQLVESVERDNKGFDLISRLPHPDDPATALTVRFIEVKGRAAVGEVALSPNEYRTADRLRQDYWLYVVYNCATMPEVHTIQDPIRLGWRPVVTVEHYQVAVGEIIQASSL